MAEKSIEKCKNDWIEKLQAGDKCAFADFVEKYKSEVFMCCRCMGLDFNDSEDVASEVFLGAYKNIKSYKGKSKLGTWVWSITYRKVISFLRKKKRYRLLSREIENGAICDNYVGNRNRLENKEQAEIVWETVMRLPKLWSVAVVLFYREEKSIHDIAKIMKTRENTVKTYLSRGRQKLKELLGADFGDSYV